MISKIQLRNTGPEAINIEPFELQVGELFLMFDANVGSTYGVATLIMFNHYNKLYELFKVGLVSVIVDGQPLNDEIQLSEVYSYFAPGFRLHKAGYYSQLSPFYFNMRTGEWTCFNPVDNSEYVIQMVRKV